MWGPGTAACHCLLAAHCCHWDVYLGLMVLTYPPSRPHGSLSVPMLPLSPALCPLLSEWLLHPVLLTLGSLLVLT